MWEYRKVLRKRLTERYPGTEFTFQLADLTDNILNFGSLAPIDLQINGPDLYANFSSGQKLAGKFRQSRRRRRVNLFRPCSSRQSWLKATGDSRSA